MWILLQELHQNIEKNLTLSSDAKRLTSVSSWSLAVLLRDQTLTITLSLNSTTKLQSIIDLHLSLLPASTYTYKPAKSLKSLSLKTQLIMLQKTNTNQTTKNLSIRMLEFYSSVMNFRPLCSNADMTHTHTQKKLKRTSSSWLTVAGIFLCQINKQGLS